MKTPPVIALHLPDYFVFVFVVCALVSACIILFVAKRHPNPHFRPKRGEIVVLSFLLLFVSGGVAFMTSGAFDANYDKEKLEAKMKAAQRAVATGDDEAQGGAGGTAESGGGGGNIPDDVPDEVREAFGSGK